MSLLLIVSLLALLLAAPDAQAGSYVGTSTDPLSHNSSPYSGGNAAFPLPPDNSLPYALGSSGYGGNSVGVSSPACTGSITATWKWVPAQNMTMTTAPPPSQVVVCETCTATTGGRSPGGSGQCDNGLGQSNSVSYQAGSANSVSASSTRYTVQTGGMSVSLPAVKASASASQYGWSCNLYYTASVSPVLVNLSGTTKDSSGNCNILVGQNCTPYLSIPGLPSAVTVGWPTWSVSGDTFTSFDIGSGQSTGQAIPFPDPNANISVNPPVENPTFFWKDANINSGTSETVQGSAILYTDAAGGLSPNPNVPPSAEIGSVSASKQVQVSVPEEFDSPTTGTPNPEFGTEGIEDGGVTTGANNTQGYSLNAAVVTPDMFTQGGTQFGVWGWLQLCQLDVTAGGGSNSSHMTSPELDSSFPSNTNANVGNGVLGQPYAAQNSTSGHPIYQNFSDTPSEGWGVYAQNFAFNNNFSLCVMYQPPDAGNGVNWVPLDLYLWGYSANITRSNILFNNWTPNPPGVVENGGKSAEPAYPTWGLVHK